MHLKIPRSTPRVQVPERLRSQRIIVPEHSNSVLLRQTAMTTLDRFAVAVSLHERLALSRLLRFLPLHIKNITPIESSNIMCQPKTQEQPRLMNDKTTSSRKVEGIDRRAIRLWRPSLNRLLEKGQFEEIRNTLAETNFNSKRWLKASYYSRDQTLLHVLYRSSPPLDIVETLLDRLEDSKPNFLNDLRHSLALCVDGCGRTPLHIAVAMGCDLELLSNLLDRLSRDAAMILANTRDFEGRVPLHFACSYEPVFLKMSKRGGEIKMITTDERLALIKLLLKASPQSVATIDYKGFTPVDYAHGKGANLKVLCILMSGLRKYVANPLCGYETESEGDEMADPVPETIESCFCDDISVITTSTDLCSTV